MHTNQDAVLCRATSYQFFLLLKIPVKSSTLPVSDVSHLVRRKVSTTID